jgi:hypothetical protein
MIRRLPLTFGPGLGFPAQVWGTRVNSHRIRFVFAFQIVNDEMILGHQCGKTGKGQRKSARDLTQCWVHCEGCKCLERFTLLLHDGRGVSGMSNNHGTCMVRFRSTVGIVCTPKGRLRGEESQSRPKGGAAMAAVMAQGGERSTEVGYGVSSPVDSSGSTLQNHPADRNGDPPVRDPGCDHPVEEDT